MPIRLSTKPFSSDGDIERVDSLVRMRALLCNIIRIYAVGVIT